MVWREWKAQRAARRAEALRKGDIIRRLHWQCWREDAPPLDVPVGELIEVLPALIESGSVGLVWPRLWHRAEELGAVGAALAAAYEAQVAHNAKVEADIARVVTRLREHGVEPVLIKGYAVARLYPAPLVRPAGDIDLVVRDEDYAAAKAALADLHLSFHGDPASRREHAATALQRAGDEPVDQQMDVDLHSYSKWYGTGVDEASFFADAMQVPIGGINVRVPLVEDHLRALCLHFLIHGAVRPLRLCDIAVLLEGDDAHPFDPGRILYGTAREREQVAVTLRLAEEVLGVRLDPALAETPLPDWLTATVTRKWGEPAPTHHTALPELLSNPGSLVRTFTKRWPDPLSATVRTGAPFNQFPRLPVEVAAYLKHAATYTFSVLPGELVDHARGRR